MTLREIVGTLWPVLPAVAGGPEGAGPSAGTSVIARASSRGGRLLLHLGDVVASVPLPPGCAGLAPEALEELKGLTVMEAGAVCLA